MTPDDDSEPPVDPVQTAEFQAAQAEGGLAGAQQQDAEYLQAKADAPEAGDAAVGAESPINSQISAALSESLAALMAEAPLTLAMALAHGATQSATAAMLNAVAAQQHAYTAANAATMRVVAEILSVAGVADANMGDA